MEFCNPSTGDPSAVLEGRRAVAASVSLHDLFEETVAQTPRRTALVGDRTGPVSYAQLAEAAACVAARLASAGVGRGAFVGIMMDRGADLIAAILGVLRTGAAYVPLDPHFPQPRLQQILDDCRPAVVITQSALRSRLPDGVVTIDGGGFLAGTARAGAHHPAVRVGPEDPIYVIYTSGSTGRPKGIVQVHGALSNLIQWQVAESGIDHSVVLQFSSICFDVHLQELFATFAAGGTVCLIGERDRRDPDRLAAVLAEHRTTAVFLSVSALYALLDGPGRLAALPDSLRDIVVAGEALVVRPTLRRFLEGRPTLRLHNHYGVSESHVVTAQTVSAAAGPIPDAPNIGRPIWNVDVMLVAEDDPDAAAAADARPAATGTPGLVWIAGPCLAREYHGNAEKTAWHFVRGPDGRRWYRTGDLARQVGGGELEFLGRRDNQVKIRGHLVEPGDTEAVLVRQPYVRDAVVGARRHGGGGEHVTLVAWYVSDADVTVDRIRRDLAAALPEYLVPTHYVRVERLPIGPTGKVDRSALPDPVAAAAVQDRPALRTSFAPPAPGTERDLADRLATLLNRSAIGADDNFFDLGADSLLLTRMAVALSANLDRRVSPVDLFANPTVRALAAFLADAPMVAVAEPATAARPAATAGGAAATTSFAIIGMAGRFPGADSVPELWRRLLAGEECLTDVAEADLDRSYNLPSDGPADRRVRRLGILAGVDQFDAEFFAYSPRDAAWMDPQHRLFLETAWHALEDAGVRPDGPDRVGVFGGCELAAYFAHVRPHLRSMADYLNALALNDKDFLTSKVAYKLGLRGPAVTVQTACSTSLVAVHVACRSLAAGECDMALAGGVSLQVPPTAPHYHEDGLIYSADGSTRPYCLGAGGTNITSGVGLVVLKPLPAAVRDGDRVYAVIRGSWINNDGDRKVGYAAPSVDGQAQGIADALAVAALAPADITFVEGHGTATPVGDAVETAALRQVFGPGAGPATVPLGSIKGNVGHLNRAAGVAGLIKAAMALRSGTLPATINHAGPNPLLGLDRSAFHVPSAALSLNGRPGPWRALVNSFGLGGTNAHVVLEAPPAAETPCAVPAPAAPAVLALSARSAPALGRAAANLAGALEGAGPPPLADVARTLGRGRSAMPFRVAVVARDAAVAAAGLRQVRPAGARRVRPASCAFVFPGHGVQSPGAGRQLYAALPAFRAACDEAAAIVRPLVNADLRDWLLADPADAQAKRSLRANRIAHPYLVMVEWALAQQWAAWGVRPTAVLGLSTGEYTAACLSGVLSLPQALTLLAERGRLMDDELPAGGMLSVTAPADRAAAYADGRTVFLAGVNSREHCVLAGTPGGLDAAERRLKADGLGCRRLPNTAPNHSPLLDPLVERFTGFARSAVGLDGLGAPTMALFSAAAGGRAADADVRSADFWANHVTRPIRFADALDATVADRHTVLLEVGPRQTLTTLAQVHLDGVPDAPDAIASLPADDDDGRPEVDRLLAAVGAYWSAGGSVDWSAVTAGAGRVVSLPGYPFEPRRHWVDPPTDTSAPACSAPTGASPPAVQPVDRWGYQQQWRRLRWPRPFRPGDLRDAGADWIIVGDAGGLGRPLARALAADGVRVGLVDPAADRAEVDGCSIATAPGGAWQALRAALPTDFRLGRTVYLPVTDDVAGDDGDGDTRPLARLLDAHRQARETFGTSPTDAWLVTLGGTAAAAQAPQPAAASLAAFRLVAPQEDASLSVRQIDLAPGWQATDAVARLVDELADPDGPSSVVELRGADRLGPAWVPAAGPGRADFGARGIRAGGSYLITGGLGRVGSAVARHLGTVHGCRVALLGRGDAASGWRRERLADLSASGAAVVYGRADVTDPDALAAAVARATAAVGPIHGVIHAAAAIENDEFLEFLDKTTPEGLERQARTKVAGLRAIDRVFPADGSGSVDFRVAFSSVATVLGGLGYGAYTAANLALAAAARDGWHVIDWDVWQMDDLTSRGVGTPLGTSRVAIPMGVGDAFAWMAALVARPPGRWWVSTTDLPARVEWSRHVGRPTGTERPAVAAAPSPEPGADGPAAHRDAAAVRRAAEQAWRDVLAVPSVADEDRFVDLGGDSLSAIRVVVRLRPLLGRSVSPREMIRARDFADFCRRLSDPPPSVPPPVASNPAASTPLASNPSAAGIIVAAAATPVSPLQQRWVQMERRGFGYLDMPVVVTGRVDPDRMRRAIDWVVARHAVLRSVYRDDGTGDTVQQPLDGWRPPIEFVDMRSGPVADRSRGVAELAARLGAIRFDLATVPPLSGSVCQLSDAKTLLLLRTHHVAFDGWSATLLLADLERAYAADANGRVEPPPPQYAAFAQRQRAYVAGPAIARDRAFWAAHFAGAPRPVRFGTADTGNDGSLAARKLVRFVEGSLAERLTAAAAGGGRTPFAYMLAAYALALHAVTGEPDLVIGTTSAGRRWADEEGMIGVFVNPLPVRIRVDPDRVGTDLLAGVDRAMDGLHEHGAYLLADLVRHVPPFVGLDINAAFHAYILFQNYPRPVHNAGDGSNREESGGDRDAGRHYRLLECDGHIADLDLASLAYTESRLMRQLELVIEPEPDGRLCLNLWYRRAALTPATAADVIDRFARALAGLIAPSGAGVSRPATVGHDPGTEVAGVVGSVSPGGRHA